MKLTLIYSPEAKEGLGKLSKAGLKNLAEKSLLRISSNPYLGKKLLGKLEGLYSSRITRRYRIVYQIIPDKQILFILDVSHRKESYR